MKTFILPFLFLGTFFITYGQNFPDTRNDLGDFLSNVHTTKFLTPDDYKKEFEGSPFLYNGWLESVITTQNGKEKKLFLMYDIYGKQMLIKQGEEIFQIAYPKSVKNIRLGKQNFIYLPLKETDKVTSDYFELLVEGKWQLLKHYRCEVIRAEKQKSPYEGQQKDRFSIKKDYYLVFPGENFAVLLPQSSNDFFEHFGNNEEKVRKYYKTNKLKLKKEKDLILLFTFLNTL